jgi:hypothetical protein
MKQTASTLKMEAPSTSETRVLTDLPIGQLCPITIKAVKLVHTKFSSYLQIFVPKLA